MKSKDVIAMLQSLDPTGECDVSVGNVDILSIEIEPAYWDGCLQRLVRDPTSQHYNVIGGEYTSNGDKIVIGIHSIRDAIMTNSDLPVTFAGGMDMSDYVKDVEEFRKESLKLDELFPIRQERRRKLRGEEENDEIGQCL